jgi:pimeloyl-ACP methyl ester carboxylesterase
MCGRRGHPPLLVLLVVLALLVGACSDDDGSDGASAEPSGEGATSTEDEATAASDDLPEAEPSTFEISDCWWDEPADMPAGTTITCGTVAVPADPSAPEDGEVALAVARLHRDGGDEAAPPLLYLHGGPGGDALMTAPAGLARLDALDTRDVVVFDQRGAGRSEPSLNCPEKEEAVLDALGGAASWEDELQANRAAVLACRERLVEEGVDLDLYDTPTSVADVEVLRETFAVDRWDVYGGSYGTRLGLAYARAHPDRVRSLVIDSVYPPEAGGAERIDGMVDGAIGRLADACADDTECTTAFGDLEEALVTAGEGLDADPEEVERTVTVGDEEVTRDFVVTGDDIRAGMFSALYDTTLVPALPSIISGLAEGDRSIIPTYVELGVPRLVGLSEGAFYSTECADGGGQLDLDDMEQVVADGESDGLVLLTTAQTFCAEWDVAPVDDGFAEQVVVDVPTLVFGGTLDPITPHADSEAQAEAMPDARFVSVERGGHGVSGVVDCAAEARSAFWADPTADLPACVEEIPVPPFTVPGG